MVDDDPADEDAVFEVDLEAVDVVSFGLAAVSSGFNALESGSILAPTTPCVELMSLPGCFYLCSNLPSFPYSSGIFGVLKLRVTNAPQNCFLLARLDLDWITNKPSIHHKNVEFFQI